MRLLDRTIRWDRWKPHFGPTRTHSRTSPTWHLDADTLAELVASVRVPFVRTGHPWRFRLADNAIEVVVEPVRMRMATDANRRRDLLACGAAIYGMRLALAVHGTPATVELHPDPRGNEPIAVLRPAAPHPPTPLERLLHTAIPRQRARTGEPVSSVARSQLDEAVCDEGGWLELSLGTVASDSVAGYVRKASKAHERSGRAEPSTGPAYGVLDPPAMRDYTREPLIGALGMFGDSAADHVRAGMALQRLTLTAAALGLSVSLFPQPIQVTDIRERLRVALGRLHPPQMIFSLGGDPGSGWVRRSG
jgi:hypothetical protein